MKHIIAAAFIVGIFALSPSSTYACFCVVPDVLEAFEEASAVFVGTVTEIAEPRTSEETGSPSDRFFTIKFTVEKQWKGKYSPEIYVLADQGRLGCFSYPTIFKGEKYLVYGDPVYSHGGNMKGLVAINACNRTGLISEQLKRPAFGLDGLEFRDFLGRRYASEDLKELEEITNTAFKVRFNRSLFKPWGKLEVKAGW